MIKHLLLQIDISSIPLTYYVLGIVHYSWILIASLYLYFKKISPFIKSTGLPAFIKSFFVIGSFLAMFSFLFFSFYKPNSIKDPPSQEVKNKGIVIDTFAIVRLVKDSILQNANYYNVKRKFSDNEISALRYILLGKNPKDIEEFYGFTIKKQKELKRKFLDFIEAEGFYGQEK